MQCDILDFQVSFDLGRTLRIQRESRIEMATKRITMGELENGMQVWNTGHLFEVRKLRQVASSTCMNGLTYGGRMSSNDELLSIAENHTIGRYDGYCVNPKDDVKGTAYDGGVYGGFSWVPVTIEIVTDGDSAKGGDVALLSSSMDMWSVDGSLKSAARVLRRAANYIYAKQDNGNPDNFRAVDLLDSVVEELGRGITYGDSANVTDGDRVVSHYHADRFFQAEQLHKDGED